MDMVTSMTIAADVPMDAVIEMNPYGRCHRDESLRTSLRGDRIRQYGAGGGCYPGEPAGEDASDHTLHTRQGTDGISDIVLLTAYHRVPEGLEHGRHTEQSGQHREEEGTADDHPVGGDIEVHADETEEP